MTIEDELVGPHLRRVLLHLEVSALRAQPREACSALDRTPLGVIFIDDQRRILLANDRASCIIRQGDGLTVNGSLLTTARQQDRVRFHRTVNGLTSRAIDPDTHQHLRISRTTDRRSLLLTLCVISTGLGASVLLDAPALAVLVLDPETLPRPCAQQLQEYFGLTPTEARVACQVAAGRAVPEIATGLGVTRHTVRTHLKHVFGKTETHRQSELVALISHLSHF